MRKTITRVALAAAAAGATLVTLALPAAGAAGTATTTGMPTLTEIRAAHHPGYDRLVFEFQGRLPAQRSARYVDRVVAVSGKAVRVVGSAIVQLRFFAATGHTESGVSTYGPAKRTYALPNIIQAVKAEDFEGVLRFGVGLARHEPFHMFTLTNPSRVVLDVPTPYQTVGVRDYFLNLPNFKIGQTPFTKAVYRPVIPPTIGFGALQRLFAGPTLPERTLGLRFAASKATGFTNLRVNDGIARVQLTGGCSSGSSTFTIANEIRPTLKQFSTVHWVKIYDPSGHTERPSGQTDSIPACLEP